MILAWDSSAAEVVRRVRALAPDPGATTTFRGQPLKVLAAGVTHDGLGRRDGDVLEPGAIGAVDERGVLVGTADGGARLVEVAPAGRRRMSAAAWARGARFTSGERLG